MPSTRDFKFRVACTKLQIDRTFLSFFSSLSTEGKLPYTTNTSECNFFGAIFSAPNLCRVISWLFRYLLTDNQNHSSSQRTCAWRIVLYVKLRLLCELYLFKVQFTRVLKRSITPTSHFRSTSYYVCSSLQYCWPYRMRTDYNILYQRSTRKYSIRDILTLKITLYISMRRH